MDPINQNQQQNSGLLRFLSAPSSLLTNSCDGFHTRSSMSRFMSPNGSSTNNSVSQSFKSLDSDFSLSSSQVNCQSQQMLPPQYPRQAVSNGSSLGESSYGVVSSLAMDAQIQGRAIDSNLTRQSSSPVGLFSNLSAQNGYASIKDTGSYAGLNCGNGEPCPSPKRLKSELSFSSGMLSQISEVLVEGDETDSSYDRKLGNGHLNDQVYSSGYPYGSWNNSVFEENIAVSQNGEFGNHVHKLSHHTSLPKPSSQLVAMEKILQFQDTVPCKIRAKRGCATHPRSIAERMRRTRISERMRKLQDLVPNMDKQTNTADMLDLAVEYIKDLQKQFKTLSDSRTKCKCLNAEKPVPNQSN